MKIAKILKTALVLLPCGLIIACGGGGETAATDADSAAAVPVPEPEPARLPDTAYASAADVKYVVEVLDTTVTARLSTLRDLYDRKGSIMTFRKGPFRQADFGGTLDTVPTRLKVDWSFDTDTDRADTVFGPWGGGTGWTGQPLYIEWPDSLARKLVDAGAVNSNFKGTEVIVGSLCGSVYFLNPDNGKETRKAINAGNPLKGTVSFDPLFNGLLYVGQGTPARRPFGAVTIDLFNNELVHFLKEDGKAYRHWGAFDSSALRVGQFVFRPAENGSLYKFVVENGEPRLHSVMRYKVNGAAPGIESSMAAFANYGYLADNHGNVLAVNLDNLQPVWRYNLGDDTDATPVVEVEDGIPYVYVGCEIDRVARGHAVFAKLNGLTGQEVWKNEPAGQRREDGKKHFDGGFYASPLLGRGDCSDLIFTNMVKNTSGSNGVFMAINRNDGKTVYELPLKFYAWSSPVGFLTKDGKQIVVTADCSGNVYIIDAKNGKIITSSHIGCNFESSPAVSANSLFVGSRSNGIYKITLE